MISELVDVQRVSSRTMFVTDRADESFSQQVSGLNVDPDWGGSRGGKVTLTAAPLTTLQSAQHFPDGVLHVETVLKRKQRQTFCCFIDKCKTRREHTFHSYISICGFEKSFLIWRSCDNFRIYNLWFPQGGGFQYDFWHWLETESCTRSHCSDSSPLHPSTSWT